MSDHLPRHHALEEFVAQQRANAAGEAGVEVTVDPTVDFVNLRGSPHTAAFLDAAAAALGQALPLTPNTVTRGAHTVYWLGPDEWLVVAAIACDLAVRLETRLGTLHSAVNVQSGGLLQLRMAGARARETLAKGCTLDLHPSGLAVGQCAQTGLAKAGVVLALHDESPAFTLIVRRSFADYVARWLAHAGAEFGVRFAVSDKDGTI